MPIPRALLSSALPLVLIPACMAEPSAPPAPTPTASSAAAPPADPEGIGAARYPVCDGQGANPKQLAPAFLDRMASCGLADVAGAGRLAELGGDGHVIEGKGDCQFDRGISCHFHTTMEFVRTSKLRDDEGAVGEMHCIVPSEDASSPTVYGAHVRCKTGTSAAKGTGSCSAALLHVFDGARCHDGWKCCDNGTLTKPVGKQTDAEKKLRPDFRVCQDASIELDCGLLHGMRGHTGNVAGLGEEVTGKFSPDEHREDTR